MTGPSKSPFAALAALRDALPPGPARLGPRADATPPPSPAYAGKLVVARSKKGRGGKTVTTITGLRGPPESLEAIAKELRHALGCGANVEDGVVVVHGDQEARARAFLEGKGAARIVMGTTR